LEKGRPKGKWRKDDKTLTDRLAWLKGRIGTYDIAKVTRAVVVMQVMDDLDKRKKPGTNRTIGVATVNRYVAVVRARATEGRNDLRFYAIRQQAGG
jgi:hypothetical protein